MSCRNIADDGGTVFPAIAKYERISCQQCGAIIGGQAGGKFDAMARVIT